MLCSCRGCDEIIIDKYNKNVQMYERSLKLLCVSTIVILFEMIGLSRRDDAHVVVTATKLSEYFIS